MADEPQTPPAVTQGNEPAARTPTGEIKDQQTSTTPASTTTTTPATTDTPAKTTEPAAAVKDDKSLLNKDDKAKDAAKPVVPEKYEFKAPEGYEIDAKFMEQATPVLKELGLSNDQAQKLVNLQIEREKAIAEAPYNLYQETRSKWREDIVKDPTLGDGSNLKPEVRASISHAIDSLPNAAAFRQVMDMTGAGDNPEFVKAFAHIAKQLGEGTAVKGGGPSGLGQRAPGAKPASAAAALYPNLPTSSQG